MLSGDCGNLFFKENIFKVFLHLCFFYPKTSNFCNSGLFGRRKLPDSLMKNIFDVLLITLQYTLSLKWPNFGLNCLVTITSNRQSLKFKTNIWSFSISETGRNCNSFFQLKLVNNNWVIINGAIKKKSTVGHVLFEPW